MKSNIGLNRKRIVLIGIALGLFLLMLFLMVVPASLGFRKGYDSSMIESKIEKECNCETVKSIKTEIDSETFFDDLKNQKHVNNFSIELSNCSYTSFEDLKANVLSVLIENNICEERNIQFKVKDFKEEDKRFIISNCNPNNN